MNKVQKLLFSFKEIGIPQLVEFAWYQLAKKTGHIAKQTPRNGIPLDFDLNSCKFAIPLKRPEKEAFASINLDRQRLIHNAKEIISGYYHPFGGEKRPLSFELPKPYGEHWSQCGDAFEGQDIKWIWEPARFSWAFELARAYLVQPDESYVQFFWEKFAEFEKFNPVNCGPNWTSAQEAAMRIIAWTMVYQVFKDSPSSTSERVKQLARSVWMHAARIPPTLGYARSQSNNHHLSEALGLIIAGAIFWEVSATAKKWFKLGFSEFNAGLLKQIEPNGTYGQHSANYHRLMLQLSLIYYGYAKTLNVSLPSAVLVRLQAATQWMVAQLDSPSGRLPNLGHNDGTLLLPMGCEEFRDYRPTAQAASLAFAGAPCLPVGAWDELAPWFDLKKDQQQIKADIASSPAVHKITRGKSWASLRGVRFHGRPAHADQLHLDLWWNGINLTLDAGTFSYNDPKPWQNSLASTLAHNTISIDEKDQMQRAGKFLWLDQAQAEWLSVDSSDVLAARHNGYRKSGVIHQRTASFVNDALFRVTDLVILKRNEDHLVILHWLIPDWEWSLQGQSLSLRKDQFQVELSVSATQIKDKTEIPANDLSVIRAGETLLGRRSNPILGWVSDTYGIKDPALSFSISYQTNSSLQIITDWKIPDQPTSGKA